MFLIDRPGRSKSWPRGNQRLFSVKYLFGEAKIVHYDFQLEKGLIFLDDRSIHVQFSKVI